MEWNEKVGDTEMIGSGQRKRKEKKRKERKRKEKKRKEEIRNKWWSLVIWEDGHQPYSKLNI